MVNNKDNNKTKATLLKELANLAKENETNISIIKNLEKEIMLKNKDIVNLKSKLNAKSNLDKDKNKLEGLIFKDGKFYKDNIAYNSINDYLSRIRA